MRCALAIGEAHEAAAVDHLLHRHGLMQLKHRAGGHIGGFEDVKHASRIAA